MGKQITWREKVRYEFDKTMSKGTIALIAWLALASLILILFVAAVVLIFGVAPGDKPVGFGALVWLSLLRTLDPGTMGGDQGEPFYLAMMLFVTLGGIFLVSALIGILTTGLDARIEELRKGRSFVVENNHTLILGWSEHVFIILSELAQANANQKDACVVILADKDKVEMEDEIRSKVGQTGKTRVVCRTGSPIDLADLEMVHPQGARSIIVLSPDEPDPDSQVIKTILAITNSPTRRHEPYHIVASISDPRNMEAAHLVGGTEAQLIEIGGVISRVTVQTCRQSGLSTVYTQLLDFGGDEIYFKEEAALVGKSFAEATFAYEDSCLMGLQLSDGSIVVNPAKSTVIRPGDKVIAISEDDDTIKLSGIRPAVDSTVIVDKPPAVNVAERTLILGWNRRVHSIINELDSYASGSEILIVCDIAGAEDEIQKGCPQLKNQRCQFQFGDISDRRTLESLQVERFNHIIVLCYSDTLEAQRADAKTLVTLLHLRDIATQKNANLSIVSEMLDDRNRALAEVTKADDFIVSDKLISLMISQVSENRYLNALFAELFSSEGAEIYLKKAGDYIHPGKPVSFYTVMESAQRRGETAIGYRRESESGDAAKSYGVHLNPKKSALVTFSDEDRIMVLAED